MTNDADTGGLLVLRGEDPAARAPGHGRPRRARLHGRPPHVLRERLRLLPRHDGRDRRDLARRRAQRPGEPVGTRAYVRRRGREPLGRVPSRGVPGARRRTPRRRRLPQQRRVPRFLQGVGRLGARVRRRLRVLGRARVGRAGARRRRRRRALDVPLRPLRRALRRRRFPPSGRPRCGAFARSRSWASCARSSPTWPSAAATTRSASCPRPRARRVLPTGTRSRRFPGSATLATDPYWKHWGEPAGPFVRRFAELLRETADRHGVGAQLWVPSFGLDREDIPELEAAIAGAREAGRRRPLDVGLRGLRAHDVARHARRAARLGGGERGAHGSAAGGDDRGGAPRPRRPRPALDARPRPPPERGGRDGSGCGRRGGRRAQRRDRRDRRAHAPRRPADLRRRRHVGSTRRARRRRVRFHLRLATW